MNIHTIHIYAEGLQNAVRPAGEDNAVTPNKPLSTGMTNTPGSMPGETETTPGPLPGIIAQVDNLQKHVESDLNIVRDPPFFPIATYQRADLIKRVRIIEEEVQRLSLDKEPASSPSASQLNDESTDSELSAALDRLFSFRDRIKSNRLESAAGIEPGSFLAVEI